MKRRFWTQSCWCSKCTPTSFKVQSRQFKVQFKVKPRLSPKRCNETKKWHRRNLRPKKFRLSGIFPVIFNCSRPRFLAHTQFSSMFNRWVQCSNQPVQCSDIVQSSARHRWKKKWKGNYTVLNRCASGQQAFKENRGRAKNHTERWIGKYPYSRLRVSLSSFIIQRKYAPHPTVQTRAEGIFWQDSP